MKRIALITCAYLFSLLFSCNREKPSLETQTLEGHTENLEIEVVVKTDSKDEFKLFLNKIKNNNQTLDIHVSKFIKEEKKGDTIRIKTKIEYFPEEIIIDLGNKTKKVIFESITYKSEDFTLHIPRKQINHFFYPNQYLTYNKDSSLYVIDENQKRHLLIFRQRIIDSLWLN